MSIIFVGFSALQNEVDNKRDEKIKILRSNRDGNNLSKSFNGHLGM